MLTDFEIKRLRYFAKAARDQTFIQLNRTDVKIFNELIEASENSLAWQNAMEYIAETLKKEKETQ